MDRGWIAAVQEGRIRFLTARGTSFVIDLGHAVDPTLARRWKDTRQELRITFEGKPGFNGARIRSAEPV